MKYILHAVVLAGLVACSSHKDKKNEPKVLPKTLEEAVQSAYRSDDFKLRDQYRHPLDTLTFFGLQPEMTVLEIWPSGGWYTQIIAPYLSEKGKYIAADPSEGPSKYTGRRFEWMTLNPEIAAKVSTTIFAPPAPIKNVENNSVDLILTFRNVHNWEGEKAKVSAFKSFHKALKPGGILGVVEHRAPADKKLDPKSGYVKEQDVIRWARAAGFILVGTSEINANPKDTKNHPEGVWTLPPALRLGEQDKAKYLEIGESDRMTLKFRK